MAGVKWQEEFRRIAQLLELDPEIVLRIVSRCRKCAPRLSALRCSRARILSARVGIGCDRTASASLSISLRQPRRSTQCPSESRKVAAARIGENRLQGAVARLALPVDRLAQAAEVDLRRVAARREMIVVAKTSQSRVWPSCCISHLRFAVDRLERRAMGYRAGTAHGLSAGRARRRAYGARLRGQPFLRHRVVFQKMCQQDPTRSAITSSTACSVMLLTGSAFAAGCTTSNASA